MLSVKDFIFVNSNFNTFQVLQFLLFFPNSDQTDLRLKMSLNFWKIVLKIIFTTLSHFVVITIPFPIIRWCKQMCEPLLAGFFLSNILQV